MQYNDSGVQWKQMKCSTEVLGVFWRNLFNFFRSQPTYGKSSYGKQSVMEKGEDFIVHDTETRPNFLQNRRGFLTFRIPSSNVFLWWPLEIANAF